MLLQLSALQTKWKRTLCQQNDNYDDDWSTESTLVPQSQSHTKFSCRIENGSNRSLAFISTTCCQIKFDISSFFHFSFRFFFCLFVKLLQILSSAVLIAGVTAFVGDSDRCDGFGKFQQRTDDIGNGNSRCRNVKNFSNTLSKWGGSIKRYSSISGADARYLWLVPHATPTNNIALHTKATTKNYYFLFLFFCSHCTVYFGLLK